MTMVRTSHTHPLQIAEVRAHSSLGRHRHLGSKAGVDTSRTRGAQSPKSAAARA